MPSSAPSSIWGMPKYCPYCLLALENIARQENAFPHTFVTQRTEALVGGGSVTPLRRPLFCQAQGRDVLPHLGLCFSPSSSLCCQILNCSSLRERNSSFCEKMMIGNKVVPLKKQLDVTGNGSSVRGSILPHPPRA